MSWAARFRVRQHLADSLWVAPLCGAVLGALLAKATGALEDAVALPEDWLYTPSTAATVLTTIVSAAVGLTGFVVTVTVLAIQMTTGTFSARHLRLWYRDDLLKGVLTALVGTLTLAFTLLPEVGADEAPDIGTTVAAVLLVASLVLFLLFFDRFIHRLRPVVVAALASEAAVRTVLGLARLTGVDEAPSVPAPSCTVVRAPRAGSVQAVGLRSLVRWADRHDRVVVLRIAVGDAVAVGDALLVVSGDLSTRDRRRLRGAVALGIERTVAQDAAFAVRVVVDVAVKALSAAINDPTTAVQVMDHLGNALRAIGSTPLHPWLVLRGRGGVRRVVLRGRTWEDHLSLAVTEIREYGAQSIQVVRRLRALLTALSVTVLPEHRAAVRAELVRLDATVAAGFARTVDAEPAAVSDGQGIGGGAG